MAELDDAIAAALRQINLQETLIIVTADHSHAFTMNGYPIRGNDILGLTTSTGSKTKFETLSYANGPGFNYHRINESRESVDTESTWRNLENNNPEKSNPFYKHFASRYLKDETHGGEDVGVYAIGT